MDALHLALSIHAVYFYIVNQLPFIHIVWYVATGPESLFYTVSQRVVFQEHEGETAPTYLDVYNCSLHI